jgi:hypothetical protein
MILANPLPPNTPATTVAITQDWKIKSRAHACAHTGRPFADGEQFYTALFAEPGEGEFARQDYSAEAWEALRGELQPFSFWKSVYEAPPPPEEKPTLAAREGPEALLRRLVEENEPHTENARYLLAVMLERRKVLRPTDTRRAGERKLLIYEHARSGEVFIVADPELSLAEVDRVRVEVAGLLGIGQPEGEAAPPAAPDAGAAGTAGDSTPPPGEPS